MAINTPLDVVTAGHQFPPVTYSALAWARDIQRAANSYLVGMSGARTLWVYVRTSAPILLATYFVGGAAPLLHLLQRSKGPHVFQFGAQIDHVTLSLQSFSNSVGAAVQLPVEGSSLVYPSSANTVRGDGYVLVSGIDQAAGYIAPPLDTSPRFAATYNGALGLGPIAVAIGPGGLPIQSISRVDLFNAGTPGTHAVLDFQVQAFDIGPSGLANSQVAGTIGGTGKWNLAAGQAESVDLDEPPGMSFVVTVGNADTTKTGVYTVILWGY